MLAKEQGAAPGINTPFESPNIAVDMAHALMRGNYFLRFIKAP